MSEPKWSEEESEIIPHVGPLPHIFSTQLKFCQKQKTKSMNWSARWSPWRAQQGAAQNVTISRQRPLPSSPASTQDALPSPQTNKQNHTSTLGRMALNVPLSHYHPSLWPMRAEDRGSPQLPAPPPITEETELCVSPKPGSIQNKIEDRPRKLGPGRRGERDRGG